MGLINDGSQPRLEAWLAEQLGARRVSVEDVTRLSGGAISENLALTLAVQGGRLDGRNAVVLRAAPPMEVSASLNKAQEFAVLRAAFAAGVAAPEPIVACEDTGLLGRAFYVMRRAEGVAAGFRVVKTDTPQHGLARELGRQLGKLHCVRPGTPGLDFLPRPEHGPARDAARLYREWAGAAAERDPVLSYGLRWLEVNAPPASEVVLCHRDYRTGNYLVKGGQLTAILDWEFAGWSDPMEDLGWFCARSWRFGRFDREAGGIADRADLYAGYEETAGRRVDPARVAYWEASAYLRWAAIAIQQGRRHISGTEPSLELALTGRMLPEIEHDLLLHLDSLEET
ncbi:phosphotransferase family protein [Azospirillum canadense]|uniref:phosphotransferase family protein n=1 Tax=Azospirillum canadense TaxID=403962 RepID=UPI0022273390|nr:phosphotransferase family protein [Azospirillum canadense]MCW2240467.1 aminoglycoside phosphotransferase (APT) family kinase protein [Azospirillum canadense]